MATSVSYPYPICLVASMPARLSVGVSVRGRGRGEGKLASMSAVSLRRRRASKMIGPPGRYRGDMAEMMWEDDLAA